MSNCYKTRSSSLPSRGGLICAFHSYFLKQNDNKSSLREAPWLERPFLLRLPGIKVVSILDRDVVMSRMVGRYSSSPECSLLQTGNCCCQCCSLNVMFNCIAFNHKSRFKFCALHQHFFCSTVLFSFSYRPGKVLFFFFLAQKDPKLSWWWKVCYSLQFVIFEPTNVRAQSCSSDCHRGQKERSLFAKFHNLPVRCYLVWKTHSDKFFTSCLAVPKNYICLTAGSQPGFSLTLPAFLFVSLLAW